MCDFLARKGNRSEVAVPLTAQVMGVLCRYSAGIPGTSGGAGGRTRLAQRMSPLLTRPSLCGGRIQSCKVLPGCVGSFPEKVTGGREVRVLLSVPLFQRLC